jgi:steroid delta-isomerase-like uncharacterized protein
MADDREYLVRRWFEEVWNQKRVDSIDGLLADDSIAHGMGPGGADLYGRDAFKTAHATFLGALPDLRITLDQVLVDGDMVAARFTCRATHRGDHLGVAATGQPVQFTGMTMARIRDGRIAEGWNNIDLLSMLQQIGAAPRLPGGP